MLVTFVMVLIVSLLGCNDVKENPNQTLIDKVKSFEVNEDQLLKLQISYDEFKEKMKDVVVDINYYDNTEIFGYSGISGNRMYLAKDLVGLTLTEIKGLEQDVENEQRKKYEEKGWDYEQHKKQMELDFGNPTIEVKLSNVYDYKEYKWKYVFSQTHRKYNDENNREQVINKRYRLAEEDGIWKILNVDVSMAWWGDNNKSMKQIQLEKIHFQTFNNEPVEYVVTFNLGEN